MVTQDRREKKGKKPKKLSQIKRKVKFAECTVMVQEKPSMNALSPRAEDVTGRYFLGRRGGQRDQGCLAIVCIRKKKGGSGGTTRGTLNKW